MIREFQTDPEMTYVDDLLVWSWLAKRSFDLAWISSAAPNGSGTTNVTLAGSGQSWTIRIAYEDFMPLWMAAKRQPAG